MGGEREFQEVVACGHLERVLRFNDQHSGCGEGKDLYFRSISTFNVILLLRKLKCQDIKRIIFSFSQINFLFINAVFL